MNLFLYLYNVPSLLLLVVFMLSIILLSILVLTMLELIFTSRYIIDRIECIYFQSLLNYYKGHKDKPEFFRLVNKTLKHIEKTEKRTNERMSITSN